MGTTPPRKTQDLPDANPFGAPRTIVDEPSRTESLGRLSATLIQHLKETQIWVRLFSVLGAILGTLGALAGLFIVIQSSLQLYRREDWAGQFMVIGVFVLVSSLLCMAPTFFLHRFAQAIAALGRGGGIPALETAMRYQRKFWRFSGILATLAVLITAAYVIFNFLFSFLSR